MKLSRILMLLCVLLALVCVCLTACGDEELPVESGSDTTETTEPTTEQPADTTPVACTHEHTELRNAKEATCKEKGYTGDTYCLDCSQVIANGQETAMLQHIWDNGEETTHPTCTTPGEKTYHCTRDDCDGVKTEPVAAINHDWDEGVIKDEDKPTCTETGTKTFTCKRDGCGATKTESVSATGHNHVPAVTPATCTAQGYTTHTCACGDTYVDTYTNALGHDWDDGVIKEGDEPTCTEAGVKTYTCKRDNCGATYTEPVPATGHNHVSAVTPATCTTQGYTTHTCACGDTYVDTYTDALGHDWDDGVIKEGDEPTHTEPGTKTYTCKRDNCGATRTEVVPATGHTSFNEAVTEPTCTKQGYTTYTCTDPECDYSYQANFTNALGHSWDEGKYAKPEDAPTCTKAGVKTYTCTRDDCGATYTEPVAALGHNYEANVTDPTCTAQGYTTHTCSRCGDSYVDTYTDALGHSWNAGEIKPGDEPTCTEAGVKTYTCTRDDCGATYTEPVAALGHNYEANVTGATCTEQGYTTHTCSRCGDSYVGDYTDALGHAWDDGEITTPATCTTKGVKTYTCTRCGETRTEELPMAAHTPDKAKDENIQRATCTQSGSYDSVIRCKDCGALISSEHKELPAEGHNKVHTGVIEATCGTNGYTGDVVCTKCHEVIEAGTVIPASGDHTWNEGEITKNPTCSEKGAKTQTCTVCGAHQSVEIPVVDHEYEYTYLNDSFHRKTCTVGGEFVDIEHTPAGEGTLVQPDCTVDGYYVYTCADCGATYRVIADGTAHDHHEFGDWTVTKAATCTNAGQQTRTCSVCGKVDTAEIPVSAEAHSWVLDHTDNASCTQTGTRYYRCERNGCDAEKTETIPMTPHSYSTYEDGGYIVKHCDTCGFETRTINASATVESLNSDKAADVEFNNGTTIQLPTEVLEQIKDTSGTKVEIKADVLNEEAKATAISNVEDEKQKAALENADIYDFGVLVDDQSLTAGGNTFDASVVVTLPYTLKDGEVAEGIVVYYVKDDGMIEKVVADYFEQDGQGYVRFTTDHFSYYAVAHEETPAMRCARGEHDYTITAKVVDATCAASGYTIVECEHCHATTVTNVTPRIAEHTFSEATVVEPTCTEQGYTVKKCSVCGYEVKSNYTKALGHTPDHAATCTEPSRCTTCNVILVPALGHNWSEWTVIAQATATREGVRQRYCPQCGTIEQKRIARLTNTEAIEFHSYQELIDQELNELLRGENATFTLDFYSVNEGQHKATVTAAKINGEYVILVTYDSEDYDTEEPTIENAYIRNGLVIQFREDGNKVRISTIGSGMSIESFMEIANEVFAEYDAIAKMVFDQAHEAIGESGDTLDMLFDLLGVSVNSEDIESFIVDAQAFYVYLAQTYGFQTGLYMDASANLPTMRDILNVVGKFAEVSETINGKTYAISIEEIWTKLTEFADAASELTDETKIAEVLFDSFIDEIQKSYPDLETVDDLKEKILEKIDGDMTAKELIDLLIDLSENSEEIELSDLYASINELVKVYASMMPQIPYGEDGEYGENGEYGEEAGMMDLADFDAEAILTRYYNMTLDELLVKLLKDKEASVAGMIDMAFGMGFADLPAQMIPFAGQYIYMMTGNERASVLDAIGIAAGMIQAYKPTLEVVIEADDFGNILSVSFDGGLFVDPQAMGGGSDEHGEHGEHGGQTQPQEQMPYGVYVWHINEGASLFRIFNGQEVYYFYEVYPDPESEGYEDYIATYTEVGYEWFEQVHTEEEWDMTVEECIQDFFETAEGKWIDLNEMFSDPTTNEPETNNPEISVGVYYWMIDENTALYRAFNGKEVYYFFGNDEQISIAFYNETGVESFERIPDEELKMSVNEFIEIFSKRSEGRTVDLNGAFSDDGSNEPAEGSATNPENGSEDGSTGEIPKRGLDETTDEGKPKDDDGEITSEIPNEETEDDNEGKPTEDNEPVFVPIYSIRFHLVINSEITVTEPELEIPDAAPTTTQNEDGSVTVSGLPEGYEWELDLYGQNIYSTWDYDNNEIYGEYVSIVDQLIYDEALSAKAGVPVYRVPNKYSRSFNQSDCVKIGGKYYRYGTSSDSWQNRAAYMIPLNEFLENPMANMKQVGYYVNEEKHQGKDQRIPVYICAFGYVFEEDGQWKYFNNLEYVKYEENSDGELIIYYVKDSLPSIPAAGAELSLVDYSQSDMFFYDDDRTFSYNGRTYNGFGRLTFIDNKENIYSVLGCVIDGNVYILGVVEDYFDEANATYIIGEEVTSYAERIKTKTTLKSATYIFGDQTKVGDLEVYIVSVAQPTYVAKIGNRYYYGQYYEKTEYDDEGVYFDYLLDANVYGFATSMLPDGNTMYVVGTTTRSFKENQVEITYGYVKVSETMYAMAYIYGDVVVYLGAEDDIFGFRSYEEIFGDHLYGLEADGTYRISAKLVNRINSNNGFYDISLSGKKEIKATADTEGMTYLVNITVLGKSSIHSENAYDESENVYFDFSEYFPKGYRLTLDTENDKVIIAVPDSEGAQHGVNITLSGGYATESWENAEYDDSMSAATGFDVYSRTVRYRVTGNDYVLQNDGQYYNYTTSGEVVYHLPKSTFTDLSVLRNEIQIMGLQFFAACAYEEGEEADTRVEGAIYRVSFNVGYLEGYYAQMRNDGLWILTGTQQNGDILNFTGAVPYANFIASINFRYEGAGYSGSQTGVFEDNTPYGQAIIGIYIGNERVGTRYQYCYEKNGTVRYFMGSDLTYTYTSNLILQSVAELPADYHVDSYRMVFYDNGMFKIVGGYCYNTYKVYAVQIDGKFYEAGINSYNNEFYLQGASLISEKELENDLYSIDYFFAVQVDGVWYRVEGTTLGEALRYEVESQWDNGTFTVDEAEYTIYYVKYTAPCYEQTTWNGKLAYRAIDSDRGYVEIKEGFFTSVQFNGKDVFYENLWETEVYNIYANALDLSAYVTVIDNRTVLVSRDLLSVMRKYNSNNLCFNGRYYISCDALQSAFDGHNNYGPSNGNNGSVDYPDKPMPSEVEKPIEKPIDDWNEDIKD